MPLTIKEAMEEQANQRRNVEMLRGGPAGSGNQYRYGPMCRHSVSMRFNCKRCDKIALDFARGAVNGERPSVVRLVDGT